MSDGDSSDATLTATTSRGAGRGCRPTPVQPPSGPPPFTEADPDTLRTTDLAVPHNEACRPSTARGTLWSTARILTIAAGPVAT